MVDSQVYEKHLAKSVSQAENNAGHHAFHCKTPDCPGWCFYDDNVNNFLCPVCDKTNCLTCRVIHDGKNCWEYQEDVKLSKETDEESKRTATMLAEMLERGEAMTCPTCDVVLMKKWGCDWLRCSMCKTEICWVTRGPRWGPLVSIFYIFFFIIKFGRFTGLSKRNSYFFVIFFFSRVKVIHPEGANVGRTE